jgi:hypothetical protein
MDSTYNLNGGFKPTLKRFADLEGPDFYPTPEWATYALLDNERFEGRLWEPACGTAYAWFVWDKQAKSHCELKWLPPGYKTRYSASSRSDPDSEINPMLFR